ncbi:MAG: ABC transporter ATP-binding protein/permease [Thaumarchaeota archaeon]|nr:ABC transporter ATP-binding protein/permease [Nitrososphaerota archaeon]
MGWRGGFEGGVNSRGTGAVIEDDRSKTQSDRALIKRLLKYFSERRREIAYVTVSVVIFTATGVVGPILTGYAIDRYIFPGGRVGNDVTGLSLIVIAYTAITVVMYVAEYVQTFYMATAGQHVIYRLRKDAVDRLEKLSLRYYNERPIGAIISHVTNDVEVFNNFLTFQSTQLISGFTSIVGIAIIMFFINAELAVLALTIVPMLAILVYALHGRMKAAWMDTRRSVGALTAKVAESVAGMKVTQSFAAEEADQAEFVESNRRNMVTNLKAAKWSSFVGPMAQVVQSFGIFAVFYFGAVIIYGGGLEIGILAAFYIWLNNLFRPVQQITQFYPQYQSAMVGLDRVLQIIDAPVDLKESPDAIELAEVRGAVDFDHVSFRYKEGDPNALSDIDVHIQPKEIVAIVGQTGAGKSTFVNLLFRYYDPDEGRVLLDGHDIRGLTFRGLRRHMAIVLQDPFLFSASVMENIRYGNLGATEEEVFRAAKEAGIHDYIMSMPQGYDTPIRESANNISTGQKQLLSIARALVANPKILVLDEATSKVDPFTELLIQNALDNAFSDKTTFIIAHRLSTIRMANRILVFDHGRLVEEGSHDALLEKDGVYARLYRIQFQEPAKAKSAD